MNRYTKRIVAFMLMVCMLCAVMAPAAVATTVDEETGAITYTYSNTTGALAADTQYGDITYLGKDAGTTSDKGTYIQSNSFSSGKWIALSINVAVAGKYTVTVRSGGASAGADVYFLSNNNGYADIAADLITESNEYIGTASTASNTMVNHSMTKEITCVEGENIFLLKGAGTGHYRFAGMTLTPVKAPAEQTYTFNTAGAAVGNWSMIANDGTYKCVETHTYTNNSAVGGILAIQVNDIVAGTYRLDFTVFPHSSGCEQNLYILPASALEAGRDVAAIKAALGSSIGIVNCSALNNGGNASQIIPYYTFEDTGDYVLVFEAAAAGRPSLVDLTIVPVEKVVNGAYYTVADAIAAGATQIELSGDIRENVVLTEGVTLDLKGNSINGSVSAINGDVIDTVGGGTVTAVTVAPACEYIPLKNADGAYEFFETTIKTGIQGTNAETGLYEFWFDVNFADARAYSLLNTTDYTIGAELKLNEQIVAVTMDAKVGEWIAKADADGDYGLGIAIVGMNTLTAGDVITVTPIFENTETGVSGMFGAAMTYTAG